VLNTILADSLQWIGDQLDDQLGAGAPLEEAAFAVLKRTMDDHGAVVFGGDGYSGEWHRVAVEERGLENLRTSADALPVLERPEIRDLFQRQGVLTPLELESRFEVYAEQYILAIEVEARLALRIARTQIYPAVMTFLARLASSLRDQEALGLATDRAVPHQVASLNQRLAQACTALEEALQQIPDALHGHLRHCADTLLPRMGELRTAVDGLEVLVDDDIWPLPTYQELLFFR
jgi:glutamine synthetase